MRLGYDIATWLERPLFWVLCRRAYQTRWAGEREYPFSASPRQDSLSKPEAAEISKGSDREKVALKLWERWLFLINPLYFIIAFSRTQVPTLHHWRLRVRGGFTELETKVMHRFWSCEVLLVVFGCCRTYGLMGKKVVVVRHPISSSLIGA